jgi:cysteine desulfurase
MSVTLPIYLDNNATTRTDPRVVDVIIPFFSNAYGNAASKSHPFGWAAEEAVDKARAQIASLIGADPREIVFTSGATESNNMAIKGVARFYQGSKRTHVITTATEHKCVLDSCRALQQVTHEHLQLLRTFSSDNAPVVFRPRA